MNDPNYKVAETLVDERCAAEIVGLAVGTLRKWRCHPPLNCTPPPYLKFGTSKTARVRYRVSDLQAWLDAQRHDPEAA